MKDAAATDRLYREASLWLVDGHDVERVVRGACDAIVAGIGGPALAELAGLSIHAQPRDIETERLVYAALEELGRPLPARGTDAARVAAATAMASEALDGRLAPRELARWAHRAIGHGGPRVLEDLVAMDDVYDTLSYIAETEPDVDQRVLDAATRLIAAAEGGR